MSDKKCYLCGKSEGELGETLVDLTPQISVCPNCLNSEMKKMSNMFGSMFPPQSFAQAQDEAKKKKEKDEKSIVEVDGEEVEVIEGQAVNEDGGDPDSEDENNNNPFSGFGFFGPGANPFNFGAQQPKRKKHDENDPVMQPVPKPHILKSMIDEYVIGQEDAKKTICVATYNHYKRLLAQDRSDIEIEKSNILMIGPTGTGKTYIIQTLAKLLDVPLAISDATTLTQAGYVGDDIESVVGKLVSVADGDIERAEHGIIYIDEIDKIAKRGMGEGIAGGRDIGGEAVQQGLLKLLEGSKIEVPLTGGVKSPFSQNTLIDTKNILFICGGAFPGLDDVIVKRLNKSAGVGFGSALKENYQEDRNILTHVEVEDLKNYGLIPEFVGRLPVISTMEALTEEMLFDILMSPKNALTKQYQALLGYDDVDLAFDDGALEVIAQKALAHETGARALRAIIEKLLLNIMYEVPKDDNIGKVTITKEYALNQGSPIIELKDAVHTPKQLEGAKRELKEPDNGEVDEEKDANKKS
ncbi:MAG: ATP-dependent Clp protease ATP-binding subunit ClpX [Coriobacteriales bacterium]|nr:ATP-dependent Clp protease ATP-binding subunit ClpX [Coriobacteriales bacterium]